MTYQKVLDYLFLQLPMFQRIGPAAFKKDLTNTLAFCEHLGQPQQAFPTIHIAGTNGKGSTAHMLAAIFTAAGYKTGLYTSPHYRDFRERIKINGELISKKFVVGFVKNHQGFAEQLKPSFFEWTVALAFEYFAKEKVDIAIIETGLGGRLDSTNVISPLVSVITNIGFDHQNMLGDTLPLIASEKAGIIKPKIPVVIGETNPETASVFVEKAKAKKSAIFFADKLLEVKHKFNTLSHSVYDVFELGMLKFENLQLNHLGNFQSKNLATVLTTMKLVGPMFSRMNESKTLENCIRNGFFDLKKQSNFMGRWEFISQSPRVLCDSAHNEDGIREAVDGIKKIPYQRLHFVFGTVNDKPPDKVLKMLPVDAKYYFAKANIPRGLDADSLKKTASQFGLKGKAYRSVRQALAAAKRSAQTDDLIFVSGSIFVVAEVL